MPIWLAGTAFPAAARYTTSLGSGGSSSGSGSGEPSQASVAAALEVCRALAGVVEALGGACSEAARAAPSLSDVAAAFNAPEEE